MWLYVGGERLSTSELMAARLDGDVVELGEAFIVADAVETPELRARSLRAIAAPSLAFTHESAAWIHGAHASAPRHHFVQRASAQRCAPLIHAQVTYRDQRLPPDDIVIIAGVQVSSLVRTLVDLVRDVVIRDGGSDHTVRALLADAPEIREQALAWLHQAGPVHHKRAALDYFGAVNSAAMTT